MVAGPQAPPAAVAAVRKELGLDRPLYVQYGKFLGHLVHFGPSEIAKGDKQHGTCGNLGPLHVDLGRSYQQRRPVTTIIGERLPRTVFLALGAATVQALLGVIAGTLAAAKKRRLVDHLAVSGSLLGVSAPTFVSGLLLQWLFAYRLRLLPLDGFGETVSEHLQSLVLPAVTLGIFGAAYYTRLVRDEMIDQLSQDYVRTAPREGLVGSRGGGAPCTAQCADADRDGSGPRAGHAGGRRHRHGTTLPAGRASAHSAWGAMLDRDGPVIMGCVIVTSLAVVLSTIAVDFGLRPPRPARPPRVAIRSDVPERAHSADVRRAPGVCRRSAARGRRPSSEIRQQEVTSY